jgi:hypothetical protein
MSNKDKLCRRCNKKEATGIIFQLCDECFSEFEKENDARETPYSDSERDKIAELVNDEYIKRPN